MAKSAKLCSLLAACFENKVAAKYINTRFSRQESRYLRNSSQICKKTILREGFDELEVLLLFIIFSRS